jgi:hypothetical protein
MEGMAPHVAVCTGKDCRREDGYDKLLRAVRAVDATVDQVPCQDICKGPVAGVELEGRWHWFAKLRTKRRRRALAETACHGRIDDALAEREVRKRRGTLRHPKQMRALR